jgi:hypothetical protein
MKNSVFLDVTPYILTFLLFTNVHTGSDLRSMSRVKCHINSSINCLHVRAQSKIKKSQPFLCARPEGI